MHLSEGNINTVTPPRTPGGRYRVTALIGSGGMGTVYRGEDALLHRPVAIKVIRRSEDSGFDRSRLLSEARAASALNHPNVCTIFEVIDHGDEPCIVMELVEGALLSTLIPPGQGLASEDVLAHGVELASALAHAHRRGVLHRDLKCANIVITSEQRVKLLDFGLAVRTRPPGTDTGLATLSDDSPPQEECVAGTLLYMAPELLRGHPADERSDIWALGVVLYEMALGERPFSGTTRYELSAAILTQRIRLDAIAEGLRGVIARCLSRDAENRYHSAAEVHAALEALQRDHARNAGWSYDRRRAGAVLGLAALVLLITVATSGVRRLLYRPSPAETVWLAIVPVVPEGTPFRVEALTETVAETVLNDIVRLQLPGLEVKSPSTTFQYKREPREKAVGHVRQELGVSLVITIGITERGETLVVSADIDDARDQSRQWGDRFTKGVGNDIFTIEREIAANVGDNICQWLRQRSLTQAERQALVREPTTHSEQAWQAYSEGRAYWYTPTSNADTYLKSLDRYQAALRLDPNFALAYVGIADTYLSLAWEGWLPPKDGRFNSRLAFEKAVAIDPSLGENHFTKAGFLWWTADWAALEHEFLAGIREDPATMANWHSYALTLALQGRFDAAIAILLKAVERDPKGIGTQTRLGTMYYWAGRLDQAIVPLQVASLVDPTQAAPHEYLADVYEAKGLDDSAIRERQEALRRAGDDAAAEGLGQDVRRSGYRAAMRTLYKHQRDELLLQQMAGRYVSPVALALLNIKLGNSDEVFHWLDLAADEEAPWLFYLKIDPAFNPVRNDPRFAEIVRRIKLFQQAAVHPERDFVVSVLPALDQTRNVIVTGPTRTSSPSVKRSSLWIWPPFSHVPFLLPASSMSASPPDTTIRACLREMPRASRHTSADGSRPTMFSPARRDTCWVSDISQQVAP